MKPSVRLVSLSTDAYDHMVASARTCYSAKGIVGSEDVGRAGKREGRDKLAADIFRAGHHTTMQHAQACFAIEGVSRHFIWTFLHSHPFYNSEQVSQRYVPVKDGHWVRPRLSGKAAEEYDGAIADMADTYHRLTDLLEPSCRALTAERFPRREEADWLEREAAKRARELARYVLPLATTAYLYHTVSILTLFRYQRLARLWDLPTETQAVVSLMIDELLRAAPEYGHLIQETLPAEQTPEFAFYGERSDLKDPARAAGFLEDFDASLDGRHSLLVGCDTGSEGVLASAVREVLGLAGGELSDGEAIRLALDPAGNRLWGETLNLSTLNRLARPLYHVHFTFRRRISHSADSQDQRHRMAPASRPPLLLQESWVPDYETPPLIDEVPAAARLYHESMDMIWDRIARFRDAGGSDEDAIYLLPNAKNVRYTQSCDLLNYRHKAAMRLCYNAQEEIWRLTLEEVEQIRQRLPEIGAWLLPPCGHRHQAGFSPPCPEGDRYCGVPVWKLDPRQMKRRI